WWLQARSRRQSLLAISGWAGWGRNSDAHISAARGTSECCGSNVYCPNPRSVVAGAAGTPLRKNGLLLDDPNCPKVVSEVTIQQIGVWHGEVALHAPRCAPRIAHDKALLVVVVADRQHRVASEHLLPRRWHWDLACLCYLLAFKAVIN